MTLLAGTELHAIIDSNILDKALHENVNASSIDVRLADEIIVFDGSEPASLTTKTLPQGKRVNIKDGYVVQPNEFILASTVERFNLPSHISSQFVLRSSVARMGLNHMLAGWADAGFHSSNLTLEFHNVAPHPIEITAGDRIGQMVFFKHSPAGNNCYSIKGRYNNSEGVVTSKGAQDDHCV